jgi:hypothetical protein
VVRVPTNHYYLLVLYIGVQSDVYDLGKVSVGETPTDRSKSLVQLYFNYLDIVLFSKGKYLTHQNKEATVSRCLCPI